MTVQEMASLGQQAMREKQSKAEKIFWSLLGGRFRDSAPNLIEAIHLGRAAADRLYQSMTEAGLNARKDSLCALACVSQNDKVKLGTLKLDHPDVSDLEMARDILNAKPRLETIGLAYFILDREKGNALMRVRPFERSERAERMLDAILREWERLIEDLNKKGPAALRPN